jgi:hypothetical protein
VISCDAKENVQRLEQLMTEHQVRHIPITDEGVLYALVNVLDLVRYGMQSAEKEAGQLRDYVSGVVWRALGVSDYWLAFVALIISALMMPWSAWQNDDIVEDFSEPLRAALDVIVWGIKLSQCLLLWRDSYDHSDTFL